MDSAIQIRPYAGSEAIEFIPELARLRMEVFRDFPYLYDGNLAYERSYLEKLVQCRESILVVAFENTNVIGVSTGLPLEAETDNIRQPWIDEGHDIHKIFYYGESVLQKEYRGRGIGVRFFEEREKWVHSHNRFNLITFCAVVRPPDHPMKPTDYVPLDPFWKKRGFTRTKHMSCQISWQDLGAQTESKKYLHFWVKPLYSRHFTDKYSNAIL